MKSQWSLLHKRKQAKPSIVTHYLTVVYWYAAHLLSLKQVFQNIYEHNY